MRLNEFIEQLMAVYNEHGNIEVAVGDDSGFPVEIIAVAVDDSQDEDVAFVFVDNG